MENKKYVRELRMGFPKTGKTYSVVSSYPRPLLILNFEAGGPDCIQESIEYLSVQALLDKLTKKETVSPLTCVDFSQFVGKISLTADTAPESTKGVGYIRIVNALMDYCPFQTIVTDPYTHWDMEINAYVGALSAGMLTQMKGADVKIMSIPQWGLAKEKKRSIIQGIQTLPANIVFIGHIQAEKDELTGSISYVPLLSGWLQSAIGGMFSQVLVSDKEVGSSGVKYIVRLLDSGLYKNLGGRLAKPGLVTCGPTFKEIYE